MTVFDNVAFPLQVAPRPQRPSKAEIAKRVSRVLATMELEHYAERHATKLSGGQQQRLALARALVIEPALLLLDEPLSNLDAKLRESLRYELKRLQRELGITSIYVTHDQVEALALSSKIAVMRNGVIEQLGKPREIYEAPRSRFVAEFIGTSNFIGGVVRHRAGEEYAVATPDGELRLTSSAVVPTGTEAMVSIRPEAVVMSTQSRSDAPNIWTGTVLARSYLGEAVDHIVAVGQREIRVRCAADTSIEPGTEVQLELKAHQLALVPMD
jgi:iron(III) transport system ATP-binding protein